MAEGHDISIENRLQQAYQQERRWYNIRGASRLVVWLIALLAVDFIIDWGLFAKTGMSGNIGVFLLLVNIGILGWVLWREWLRYLRPYDPVTTSLDVEKHHPGLRSLLVSYMQLKDGPGSDQDNVSQSLIDAMRDQAIERSRPIDFKEIVDFGQLRKISITAGGVFLVFAILGALNPDHTATLLKRLTGSNVEYPTQTVVAGSTGDLTIRIGSDATISATASTDHVIPEKGTLYFKEAGSEDKWKGLPMKKVEGSENEFSRQITAKNLTRDTLFYVRLGDHRSVQHSIRIITAPRITDIDLVLEYPEYMDKENGKSDQLNLEVQEGTTVKWTVSCDTPVSTWEVLVPAAWGAAEAKAEPDPGADAEAEAGEKPEATEDDTPKFRTLLADLDESGTTATFELPIEKALRYSFRWVEKANGFSYEDVQHGVKVTSDGLPDVDLLQPREVGYATAGKVVKMEAKGTDDIGLDKAWLVYSLNGEDENKVEIFNFNGDTNKTFDYTWKLSDSLKELKPNDRISFAIEVADRHPDRKIHLRRTAPRQLTVVTPETYLDWYRAEYGAQIEELKRSRNQELAAQKAVSQLKTEEGIEPTEPTKEEDENE
ncbi:MAG: hypothetical protein VCA40_02085 [Roseibacillus sp.]